MKVKKDVVLCKDCVYCKYERINTSDEKALLFAGFICQHFSQQVFAEDYCSYGGKKNMSIDRKSDKTKEEIIKKVKTGQELSKEELEELAYYSSYTGLFEDNFVDLIRKRDCNGKQYRTTILQIDKELYAVDWRENGAVEGYRLVDVFKEQPYKVKEVKRIIETEVSDYVRVEE